jgi:hypothetical protein
VQVALGRRGFGVTVVRPDFVRTPEAEGFVTCACRRRDLRTNYSLVLLEAAC